MGWKMGKTIFVSGLACANQQQCRLTERPGIALAATPLAALGHSG